MRNLALLLGGAAALGVVALTYRSSAMGRSGTVGDAATLGDVAFVPTSSLPAGALPPAIPQGVGFIGVRAAPGSTREAIQGPIVSYMIQELPTPLTAELPVPAGPVSVPRSAVTSVYRDGRKIA